MLISKPYPLNEDYLVYENGTIEMNGVQLKQRFVRKGERYLSVSMVIAGKLRIRAVHRIVAYTFFGSPGAHFEVNHKDGNKLNNHISNLEYVTHRENMQHAAGLGILSRRKAGTELAIM